MGLPLQIQGFRKSPTCCFSLAQSKLYPGLSVKVSSSLTSLEQWIPGSNGPPWIDRALHGLSQHWSCVLEEEAQVHGVWTLTWTVRSHTHTV